MSLCYVVDELHDEHGLPHSGTTKQSNLATTLVGGKEIHHLTTDTANTAGISECVSSVWSADGTSPFHRKASTFTAKLFNLAMPPPPPAG